MKLKSNEIRTGNWIQDENGEQFQSTDYTPLIISRDNKVLLPIPLTEEWLLKFGFNVEIKKTWSFGYEKDYNVYTLDGLTYNGIQAQWWYVQVLKNQPQFVHQLQNLYFALTGTELEIK